MVFATKQMAKCNSESSRLSFPGGLGGAQIYADREQYETAKKTAPTTKKLSWMEQREWDQMEEKVQVAETALELAQQALGDPKVMADRHRMAEASKKAADQQAVVDKLYKRWQDLEVKRG